MRKTALEFAQGTTDANKKVILGMFSPGDLLNKYRTACAEHNTRDIVLWTSVNDPTEFFAGSRLDYCEFLKRSYPRVAHTFAMWRQSAHSVVKSPQDIDAFWLVITIPKQEMPSMTVLFAVPYEETAVVQ